MVDSRLYGIYQSNREGRNLWGKNQFNSTFPASLACYMRDNNIKPVYLELDGSLEVTRKNIPVDDLFNSTSPNEELSFEFETKYTPYQEFAYDDIGNIDLVIKYKDEFLRPLEVKLTVVPDESTHDLEEESWSPELVIRPATTIYCALGIADSCKEKLGDIRRIFEPRLNNIRQWDNEHEILARLSDIVECLNEFQEQYYSFQKPLLMQPIWKTIGKTPELSDSAFDIFVWSDFSLCRLFIDKTINELSKKSPKISRFVRSTSRFARFMNTASISRKVNIATIYTEMAHSRQTDKEFAASGKNTHKYLNCERLINPKINKTILKEIILDGGEKLLSPERRFDATIFFTANQLFDKS